MARVALGSSLRNPGHVRKGAASYAHNIFCPPWDPHCCSHRRPPLSGCRRLPPAKLIADSVKRSSRANLSFLLTT
jgi:hypothetical protein